MERCEVQLLQNGWDRVTESIEARTYAEAEAHCPVYQHMARTRDQRLEYVNIMKEISERGIRLDMDTLNRLSAGAPAEALRLAQKFALSWPEFITIKKDIGKLETKKIGIEIARVKHTHLGVDIDGWPRTTKGSVPTDELSLWLAGELSGNALFREVQEYKKSIGILSFLKNADKKNKWTDYIKGDRQHPVFDCFGSKTGRCYAKAKSFMPANGQELRDLIIPSEGMKIYSVDYSQQEFLIGAILSEDKRMLEDYETKDVYLSFATRATGSEEEGKKSRSLFKATILGRMYGLGKANFQWHMIKGTKKLLSKGKTDTLYGLFEQSYGTYLEYCKKTIELHNIKGHSRTYDWAIGPSVKSALTVQNFPMQATGASVLRKAIQMVHPVLKGLGGHILYPLHDEIVFELPEQYSSMDVEIIVCSLMQEAFGEVMGSRGEGHQVRVSLKEKTP